MSIILAQRKDIFDRQWLISKETADGVVTISVVKKDKNKPDKVVSEIKYRDIGREYQSDFLNWENLVFCSNNYGVTPFYDYMHNAVQIGKKTAATVYLQPGSQEARQLIRNLPKDCDWREYESDMIFVFHTGRLADYFDYTEVKEIYDCHGIWNVDWNWVEEQFIKPISYFAKPEICGFNLQNGGCNAVSIVTGLLLGYPIESTVCWLGGN